MLPKQDGSGGNPSDPRPLANGSGGAGPAIVAQSAVGPAQPSSPKVGSARTSPRRPENGIKHKPMPNGTGGGHPLTLGELREEMRNEINRFGSEVLRKEIDGLGKRLETFMREQWESSGSPKAWGQDLFEAPALDRPMPKLRRGWSKASSQRSASKDSTGATALLTAGHPGGKNEKATGRASQYSQDSGASHHDEERRFKPKSFHVRPRMSTRHPTISGLSAEVFRQIDEAQEKADEQPFVPTSSSSTVKLLDPPPLPSVRTLIQQADIENSGDEQKIALLQEDSPNGEEEKPAAPVTPRKSQHMLLEESPPTCCQQVREAVQSEAFDHLVGVLILLNAVLTGFQAEFMARNWTLKVPEHFVLIDHIFCMLFTAEMLMRIFAYGKSFVAYAARNTLDCGIVIFQIFDEVVSFGAEHYSTHSESVLRMVRIFRLIRILRLARLLSLIGELRMLVVSILDSMRALIWTITLIWLIIYMFAVYFTQLVTEYKVDHVSAVDEKASVLLELYGSLGRTMLCLYEAICAGRHWDSMLEPLLEFCDPWLSVVFVIYITICLVGVMNMVTSVFVTSAMQNVEEDRKQVLMQRMYAFFEQADEDQSGTISLAEFEEHIQDPQFQLYLKEIDLNPEHGRQLFNLLDDESIGEIAIEDIVSACVRLHGPAKALDHANMMGEVERLSMSLRKHQAYVDSFFQRICSHLGVPPVEI